MRKLPFSLKLTCQWIDEIVAVLLILFIGGLFWQNAQLVQKNQVLQTEQIQQIQTLTQLMQQQQNQLNQLVLAHPHAQPKANKPKENKPKENKRNAH